MTTRTNMSKYIKRSGIHSPMRLRGKNILFNCDLGFNPCSVLIICIFIITTSPVEDSLSSLRMSLAGQKKCNHQRWWLRSWKLRCFSCLASVQNYFLRFSMSVFVHALIISISDIDNNSIFTEAIYLNCISKKHLNEKHMDDTGTGYCFSRTFLNHG